ncbi:hypothetical protein LP414_22160 [Polaromonas sp. P1(28)-13]|nr:hypothetical protein LP414_22160 [Polaromonas sp. P1(28)-13]
MAKTGYNHRQFIRLFSGAVGLTPKVYCRVQRFQKALTVMSIYSRQRRSGALDSRVQGAKLPLFDPFDN